MVRLKFIIRSGSLVLRISEGKERYYKKVHSLLIGNPDIKYWDSNKEKFNYRCPSYIQYFVNFQFIDSFIICYVIYSTSDRNLYTCQTTINNDS